MEGRDFGGTTEDVQRYGEKLSERERSISQENDERKRAVDDLWETLQKLSKGSKVKSGVKKAEKLHAELEDALKKRRQAYEDDLAAKKKADKSKGNTLVRRAARQSEAAIACKKCRKPVKQSNVVLVDDKDLYHSTCFVCSECSAEFVEFYWETGDKPYCFPHYAALTGLYCARCKQAIEDAKVIKALKQKWHKKCFKCTTCGKRLSKKHFYGHENLPYCKQDYYRAQNLLCARCDKVKKTLNFLSSL